MSNSDNQKLKSEWQVFGERSIYQSDWVNLNLADVESPDGERFDYHVVRMRQVVGIVIPNQFGQVLLVWHHRFINSSWGWEIPCGVVEKNETTIAAAAREAEEETGYRPYGLKLVVPYQPSIGIADTPHEIFMAKGATLIGEPTDSMEVERIEWFSFYEIRDLIAKGQIHDSPTLIGLLASASRAGVQLL